MPRKKEEGPRRGTVPHFLGIFPYGGGSCLGCRTMGSAMADPAIAHAVWIVPGDIYLAPLCQTCIEHVETNTDLKEQRLALTE